MMDLLEENFHVFACYQMVRAKDEYYLLLENIRLQNKR